MIIYIDKTSHNSNREWDSV